MALALDETDVDEIFNMLDILGRRGLSTHVRTLRRHHCPKLIPDERYRTILAPAQNTDMLWQHLDDLVAATKDKTLAIAT